jgi:leucyl aminopeptidase (aminopeptidase T)
MAQPLVLDDEDLTKLIDRVFQPGTEDRSLAFLLDLPDAAVPDRPDWQARRETVLDWYHRLAERNGRSPVPQLYFYRNVRSHNAELPAGAWRFTGGRLPAAAEELAGIPVEPFPDIFSRHSIFLAVTEFSATAPLRNAAPDYGFRAASMPGFSAGMVPALRLDLDEVHRRVEVLVRLLDQAHEARLVFTVDRATEFRLTLDLRHRQGHSSSGLLREPGRVGNLPSGEAFIVPYEGERDGDPSRSHGFLPVEMEGEIVVYRIENNQAVAVESSGAVSERERLLLEREPATGNLAELGLGVLAGLGIQPIGENLLDEKLGLHIAFGRSDHFGGQVGPQHFHSPEAVVHIDRVYVPDVQPRINVRSLHLILDRGARIEVIEDCEYTDLLQEGMSTVLPLTGEEQYEAFAALLSSCLEITQKDDLLVIYDEGFLPFMDAFLRLVKDRKLFVTFLNIPQEYQLALTKWTSGDDRTVNLPEGIGGSILNSSAIITMVNGELETNRIRRALLQQTRSEACRLAHIPGISSEVLRAVRSSPFEQIMVDSELLAWALGEAWGAELTTFDSKGQDYTLHLNLGGWDNEPLMSPGVLGRGSWGNVPPGETFCCPLESSVQGEVCIDGSVPHRVLAPGEELVIRFDKGKAVKWWAPSGPEASAGVEFIKGEKTKAGEVRDRNWNTFAELGIGLNPAITKLTGNSLFDEKALGTVHVAIGDNSLFGHNTEASIHADMVTHRPNLKLDGHTVIEGGKICRGEIEDWRGRVREAVFSFPFDRQVALRQAKVKEQNGVLLRQLRKAGRVGYIQILDDEGGRALAALANALINLGAIFPEDLLHDHEAFQAIETKRLLGVLYHYGALEFLQ